MATPVGFSKPVARIAGGCEVAKAEPAATSYRLPVVLSAMYWLPVLSSAMAWGRVMAGLVRVAAV